MSVRSSALPSKLAARELMMRLMITGMLAGLFLVGAAPVAIAQRDARDAADRGQRLDSDALRNDMLQRQLKAPEHPLWSAPTSAEPAKPAASNKRKKTDKKN
jgi:hypothetical protein